VCAGQTCVGKNELDALDWLCPDGAVEFDSLSEEAIDAQLGRSQCWTEPPSGPAAAPGGAPGEIRTLTFELQGCNVTAPGWGAVETCEGEVTSCTSISSSLEQLGQSECIGCFGGMVREALFNWKDEPEHSEVQGFNQTHEACLSDEICAACLQASGPDCAENQPVQELASEIELLLGVTPSCNGGDWF
jgi:hypothetical protein